MLVLLNFYKEKFKYAFLTLTLVTLSNVRSVLIGIVPILPLMVKRVKASIFDIYMISTVLLSTFIFFYLFNNLEDLMTIFGDSANSFSWRLYHWNNIFKDFEFRDWIFGKGLGFSWRTTLFIEDFYTDGSTYVAAHSNYVKIIADTGILGLVAFIATIFLIYVKSSKLIKFLIVFYLSYGFYDEGVWFFSLFWLVILTYDRMKESDFDTNYDQR
jgi:O-antigen ligase